MKVVEKSIQTCSRLASNKKLAGGSNFEYDYECCG
jgi:hypothetical protein